MIRGSEGREKMESRRIDGLSPFYTSFILFYFFDRPKKMFRGKDCSSLAVAIGAGMSLHPIIVLHSTRRKCKLGLMSLNKYNLNLVMGFLHEEVRWQVILPSFRAKKDLVAPTSNPAPPP
jgi:hypothetical protein